MNCKLAIEEGSLCGKNTCCYFCDELEDCPNRCGHPDHTNCEDLVQKETELQVMQSAVPEAIRIITDITLQKKKLDEQEKVMRQKLLEAMETFGVKKFENEHIAFTYVAPTTKTTVDSTKLKKKYPDIAEECSKVSNVSASVRINVK